MLIKDSIKAEYRNPSKNPESRMCSKGKKLKSNASFPHQQEKLNRLLKESNIYALGISATRRGATMPYHGSAIKTNLAGTSEFLANERTERWTRGMFDGHFPQEVHERYVRDHREK